MATKTANVLARVEPEIKEQAEAILNTLGVPASTVINMLYRQIILTKSIPFSLSVPAAPTSRADMSDEEFYAMMQRGLDEAKTGQGISVDEAFERLYREI